MTLATVHAALSNSAILFLILCGFLGMVSTIFQGGVSPAFRGALAIGEVLLLVVAGIGLAVLFQAGPPPLLHFLYGGLAVLALPGIFAFTRGRTGRREALTYALACWVMVGFIIRAGQTR